ncbi:MAG: FKBP-type peptidyl-prolyl cis-trans isomerase [Legionellales bacterium]|nr:FKBP-type peptidyl-prolyl cis-trans isomerase [Legionellales bacterium]
MKLRLMSTLLAGLAVSQFAIAAPASAPATLQDQISYTIGVDMGKNLKSQAIAVNPDMLAQGIKDGMAGTSLLMTQAQMDAALKQFQQQMSAKQQQAMQKMSEQNTTDGAAFLAKNKKQPGIVTLKDGLQYKVMQPGDGNSPLATDTVSVDYEGSFINGQVFSSTYQQGQPVTFQVSQVIPGWQEALKMMKPGAEWMLYIPANLAYGAQGVGDSIGPNETLVFKIHLLSIVPPTAATAGAAPAAPTAQPAAK